LSLLDVMAIVVSAAAILALITYLVRPLQPERVHEAALAIYLAVLCTAALAARAGRPRWRPFWSGLALFAGMYLVTGLKMGWGVRNHEDSESLLFRCQIALLLGLLCGMATQWLVRPGPSTDEHEGRPPPAAVEGSIMEHDRPRWRFRLSTLMLLVIIGALALTLVLDRWKREQDRRRLEAALNRAVYAQWAAAQGQASSQSR